MRLVSTGALGHQRRLASGTYDAYAGVPAPHGETWPLSWRCPPLPDGRFVDPAVLCGILTERFGVV